MAFSRRQHHLRIPDGRGDIVPEGAGVFCSGASRAGIGWPATLCVGAAGRSAAVCCVRGGVSRGTLHTHTHTRARIFRSGVRGTVLALGCSLWVKGALQLGLTALRGVPLLFVV